MTTFYPTTNGIPPKRQPSAEEATDRICSSATCSIDALSQVHWMLECRFSRDSFRAGDGTGPR
jgi:hypothetical protein